VILQPEGFQFAPAISPDGRWLAYQSTESGSAEVYVMPFAPQNPTRGGKRQISNGGGETPIWSHNSRELFYESRDRRVEVVAYTVKGESFVSEKPRFWSDTRLADPAGYLPGAFDVAPDGKRVLALLDYPTAGSAETHLRILLNVGNELRRGRSGGTR
jgi:eukaryotic-like serine/threonine-protein kinase